MTTLRICYQNYADSSLITAAHAISSLPASNLKDEDIQKLWRDTGSANTNLTIDLGSQLPINVVGLLTTNLSAADGIRVRVSTADATGVAGDAYDQSAIDNYIDPVYAAWWWHIEPAVTGRYVRIDLFSLLVTPEAGRLIIGPTWTPSHHFTFGWQPLWRDASRRTYSLGQNVFTDVQKRGRGYRFTLKGLTTTEVQSQVAELNRLRGIGRDIMVCLNKDSTNLGRDTIWGLMETPAVPTQIERTLWEAEFEVFDRL